MRCFIDVADGWLFEMYVGIAVDFDEFVCVGFEIWEGFYEFFVVVD